MRRLTNGQATAGVKTAKGRRMTCWDRSNPTGCALSGYGERLLPRSDFTAVDQFTLIGSGMIWNVYYGFSPESSGFLLGKRFWPVGKGRTQPLAAQTVRMVYFSVPDGSPLFIQFFFRLFLVP